MSEWWTYRLSDFLMFSARTYHRLFEIYNADVWPAHAVALGLGGVIGVAAWRGNGGASVRVAAADGPRARGSIARSAPRARAWASVAVFGVLALAWGWVGWAFHVQRYATINWAAVWFGVAFGVQGLLLLGAAWRAFGGLATGADVGSGRSASPSTAGLGAALLLFALVVQPLIGMALGRPWQQAELFGIAPDPTASATLGLLLMLHSARPFGSGSWLLWPVPLLWCAVAGATAWAMDARDAWLMPGLALTALAALAAPRREAAGSA
ncbi:MAG: hypothetical protein AD742_17440 [Methylibium sp. NZG]|nr:MAG: hypothetical protein AD742_17440 [Methylibium sp. NZG]